MLKVTITTLDEQLFNEEAYSVTLPGSGGEMTLMGNHMPLITTLAQGTIRVKKDKDAHAQEFSIKRGLLEISNNQAVVLV